MAKVVYTLGEVTGSIGGLTFQRNTSGAIIRTRPAPSKSSTTAQTEKHIAHINWLFQWQQLTQAQRDAWNTFAATFTKINRYGQTKTLTGQNWFESLNYYRADIGEVQLSNPPVHTLPSAPPNVIINITEAQITLTMPLEYDYTNNPFIVWVSPPTRISKGFLNPTRRFATIIQTDPGATFNLTSFWETATTLPWAPATLFPNANIHVCYQSIRRDSGITSALLCGKASTEDFAFDNLETDTGENILTDAGLFLAAD